MTMLTRMKPALAVTAILLTMTSTGALADMISVPEKDQKPPVLEVINKDGSITVEGSLEWIDLEGGYYQVNGWALMGDDATFASLAGKTVVVTGKEFNGMSIRMVKSLEVSTIWLKEAATSEILPDTPVLEPIRMEGSFNIEGTVEYSDLEGGFYTVDGWGLLGDKALIESVAGKRVIVKGKEFTGMSVRQVRQIEVESILLPVSADHVQPAAVVINGRTVDATQAPMVVDGALMLPLRAVVETAGGRVEWEPKERMVIVTMPDRMAYFWIDKSEAEMNENNVRYLRQNLLPMERASVIVNGRTYISADALTQILGLAEVADLNESMDLAPMK